MTKTKIIALALVAVLMVGGVIGGSFAWLVDTTGPVVNTFTAGDVNIALSETTGPSYKIIPGTSQDKDPKVTVEAGSEAAWVFVKVEEVNNAGAYIDYTIDVKNGEEGVWTALDGFDGVYYVKYTGSDAATYPVLKGDEVSYANTLTKESLDLLDGKTEDQLPKLSFTAYAIQAAGIADNAVAAWNALQNQITPPQG